MSVKEEKPITMAEVVALAGKSEKAEEIKRFIGNFIEMTTEKAIEIKEELTALNLLKLKESHIVKIVDFLPKDATELNKVLIDVTLDADEVNKILDVSKKY